MWQFHYKMFYSLYLCGGDAITKDYHYTTVYTSIETHCLRNAYFFVISVCQASLPKFCKWEGKKVEYGKFNTAAVYILYLCVTLAVM